MLPIGQSMLDGLQTRRACFNAEIIDETTFGSPLDLSIARAGDTPSNGKEVKLGYIAYSNKSRLSENFSGTLLTS